MSGKISEISALLSGVFDLAEFVEFHFQQFFESLEKERQLLIVLSGYRY